MICVMGGCSGYILGGGYIVRIVICVKGGRSG